MSQSTLGDEDLFGEAAEEIREEVEHHLAQARESLPAAEAVWEVEGDNVLGVLNGLKGALDVGDAAGHLKEAKKQFVVGERAEAFDDPEDLREEIEAVEELLADVERAAEQVGELTTTVPQLRSALQAVHEDAEADADAEVDEA